MKDVEWLEAAPDLALDWVQCIEAKLNSSPLPIARLNVPKSATSVLSLRHAKRLSHLPVQGLRLWCHVTSSALRQVLQMPSLTELDVLKLPRDGRLRGFAQAHRLRRFATPLGLSAAQLQDVASCQGLTAISAQTAQLSIPAMVALAALPGLQSLDLEATGLDDRMAWHLARSRALTRLDAGGTRIGRKGLERLLRIQGMQAIDLWDTRLSVADLQLVRHWPHLRELTVGQTARQGPAQRFDPDAITQLLLDCPSLQRAWVDGVSLQAEHVQALQTHLELRFDPPDFE